MLLTPYLGIVGIRYGTLLGHGASLTVFGLTALSVVAAYRRLSATPSIAKALKIVQSAAVLRVGYAVIVYANSSAAMQVKKAETVISGSETT